MLVRWRLRGSQRTFVGSTFQSLVQLLDLIPFSLAHWTNLTGAAINMLVPSGGRCSHGVPHLRPWISPSATFLCLWPAVCPTSHTDLWYKGVREGTRECELLFKWITSLFGAAQARRLKKVRGEAWQGFANQRSHTWLRDRSDSAFQKPHILCAIFSKLDFLCKSS